MIYRLVIAAVGLALAGGVTSAAEKQPHIVIMLADDLGWGDVGYHGSRIATPNIDALAKAGVRLNQFYVQPVCSPTRGALMTGRYPIRLGLQCGVVRPWAQHGLPKDETTLAQALRNNGYRTAIVGKWHLGHANTGFLPTKRGFDAQYGHYNGALDYFTHVRDGGHDWHRNDQTNRDEGYATNLIAREAERLIAEHDQSRPLFLYVPFNAPHTPLQAPRRYIEKYSHMADKDRRVYAAMVDCMDVAVGRIVSALEKHGFPAEDTLIFFCSDNGGIPRLGSNRELRSGKGRLYEGGVRVPAVIVWKDKLPPGTSVDEPLHIVDLYPTLLGLTGTKTESRKPLDGRDAWPTLAHGMPTPHDFILHNVTPFNGAIRVGDWKLVRNGQVTANAIKGPAQSKVELFNIAEDPSEKHDLRAQHPDIVRRLTERLDTLAREASTPHLLPNRAPKDFAAPRVWGETE